MRSHTIRLFVLFLIFLPALSCLPAHAQEADPAATMSSYYKTTGPLVFMTKWGKTDGSLASIYSAGAITTAPNGDFLIGHGGQDMKVHRVIRFTADGALVSIIKSLADNSYKFLFPSDIAYSPDGSFFLVSTTTRDVTRLSATGEKLAEWDAFIVSEPYDDPASLAIAPDKSIYTVCRGNGRINKFTYTGKAVWSKEAKDYGDDDDFELDAPFDCVLGSDGVLYIADTGNSRVVRISSSGVWLGVWERKNGTDLLEPRAIDQGIDGNYYLLADERPSTRKDTGYIQRVSASGAVLSNSGRITDAGANMVVNPMSLTAMPDGRVAVLECDFTIGGKSGVRIFRPEYYQPAGVLGKIVGVVRDVPADQLANITIVLTATDKSGAGFFASVRPAANGKYTFKKFPVGAKYTLTIRGHNSFTLKSEPAAIQGTAVKANKGKDFRLVAK